VLLQVKDIGVNFGKVAALKSVSMELPEGGMVTLIGSNGAGKTTTLRAISGLARASKGEIWFDGQRIDTMAPDRILKLGIAHVPEGRRVFRDLTVTENLRLGAYTRSDREGIESDLEETFNRFPRLRERSGQLSKTMSGGEQQMLAVGRALMSRPRLLLLDEPSLGLAPLIVREIARILVEINKRGVAVVLVEQNAELALEITRYAYVLETGRLAMEGESSQLMNNEHVRKAYLGL